MPPLISMKHIRKCLISILAHLTLVKKGSGQKGGSAAGEHGEMKVAKRLK